MSSFDIYVHGTPRGHQIWGSERSHDYISTFYNHDSQASDKVVLQIDICDGDSFYTYICHQNVYDIEGRPQAFFALSVGFRKAYCTNIYILYQLFDAVYNQICVGTILKQSGIEERFLVADLTVARSGGYATVDKIKAAFTQKITELIVPTLQPVSFGDTFNKPKKIVSLLEVNSPLFFDYFKKYSVIVSPNKQPSAVAYDNVASELKQVIVKKESLLSSNRQLQLDIASLTQEKQLLSDKLQTSVSKAEKKYKDKLNQLQSDLDNVTIERDALKQKIKDASKSIEQIDQPIQKLTRLLAGRFSDSGSSVYTENEEDKQESTGKNKVTLWRDWLNSILLALVLICCCTILFFVVKVQRDTKSAHADTKTEVTSVEPYSDSTAQQESSLDTAYQSDDSPSSYDPWEECFFDIKGGGDILNIKKNYTLSITKGIGGPLANVPNGEWVVCIEEGNPINKGNTFTILSEEYKGKNIVIEYKCNNEIVKSRTCIIQ